MTAESLPSQLAGANLFGCSEAQPPLGVATLGVGRAKATSGTIKCLALSRLSAAAQNILDDGIEGRWELQFTERRGAFLIKRRTQ